TVVPEKALSADGIKAGTVAQNWVGETKSYAPDALPVIDAASDDAVLHDCHLLDDRARASKADMHVEVQRIVEDHAITVRLHGSAENPLVLFAPPIEWDFLVGIDTSRQKPTWTIQGDRVAFPAFE